jgi:ferrochelatase
MTSSDAPTGVLLMTYGSPSSIDDVERYLTAVRGGRTPDPELVTEFRRRYEVIGGSPLIERTRAQAAALERHLGRAWRVSAAMRFSEPSIQTALRAFAEAGIEEAVAVILSPQFSPLLMGGYERDVAAARVGIGAAAPVVAVADAWYRQPSFIEAMAGRIRGGLSALGSIDGGAVPVLLTAHSLPRTVAEREPAYLDQLSESAHRIATAAGLGPEQWTFCWQSAGHEPGEWMQPDFAHLMPRLAAEGHDRVLVAPIQFLADHLEILYDVDIGAREQAESAGLRFSRIASLNDDPGLIRALAAVVRETCGTAV